MGLIYIQLMCVIYIVDGPDICNADILVVGPDIYIVVRSDIYTVVRARSSGGLEQA